MMPTNESNQKSSSTSPAKRKIAALVLCVILGFATSPVIAQAPASDGISLQPYTAPDQSASAGVPAGWKVKESGQTVITMDGPEGEHIYLGKGFIARNGAYQSGQRPSGGIDLAMPFSANLSQKFLMLIDFSTSGASSRTHLRIVSATPIQVPAILGQCGHFLAENPDPNGPTKIEAVFCSLPMDAAGIYKNFFKMASAPANIAAQVRPTAQAVFASYRVPRQWLELKLAPTVARPAGNGGMRPGPGYVPGPNLPSNVGTCFDLAVIRETPRDKLPPECGGPGAQ